MVVPESDNLNLRDTVLNKPKPCLPSVALAKGGAKPKGSNLYLPPIGVLRRAFEIATAAEYGLAMTQKRNLYPLNGYQKSLLMAKTLAKMGHHEPV